MTLSHEFQIQFGIKPPASLRRLFLLIVLACGFLTGFPCQVAAWTVSEGTPSTGQSWVGCDGKSLPFQTFEEVEDFLRDAVVVEAKHVGSGINNPWKLTLKKDGVCAHGCFRDVSVLKQNVQMSDGFRSVLRDEAAFEVAAYRLSQLLGIDKVPPAVMRTFRGKRGSLQLWMENTLTEKKRLEEELKPTDIGAWRDQYEIMVLFDALIGNSDRNQGNILFDRQWNRWLIDHTRAFETEVKLQNPGSIRRCDPGLFDRLLQLNERMLKSELGDVLNPWQIRSLLKRRDSIVQLLQHRIDEFGAPSILAEFAALK